MHKEQVFGGIFRGLVSGGSWIRITIWTKSVKGRRFKLELEYQDDLANWTLVLFNADGSTKFAGAKSTLEAVTIEAVAALGKET